MVVRAILRSFCLHDILVSGFKLVDHSAEGNSTAFVSLTQLRAEAKYARREETRVSDPPSVAVCVSGQLRTHLFDEVQDGFAKNFHRPGYEYFLSIDVSFDATTTVLQPVKAMISGDDFSDVEAGAQHDSDCKPGEGTGNCPSLAMAARYVRCYDAIESEENSRQLKYDYILRVRPDNVFAKPFPHVTDILSFTKRDVVMFDDHIALARREHADMVLLNLVKVFTHCHTPAEWTRACEAAWCSEPASIPKVEAKDGKFIGLPCSRDLLTLKYSNFAPTVMFYRFNVHTYGCDWAIEDETVGVMYYPNATNPHKHGTVWYFR